MHLRFSVYYSSSAAKTQSLKQTVLRLYFDSRYDKLNMSGDENMAIATYYLHDPNAPKPNMPIHLGANLLVCCDGKLLLERRTDCDQWGLIGGGRKKGETPVQNAMRELLEETGLRASKDQFQFRKTYDDPGRIASYQDGSVWAMIISVFRLDYADYPQITCSKESRELRFFTAEELTQIPIVTTHSDIISDYLRDLT